MFSSSHIVAVYDGNRATMKAFKKTVEFAFTLLTVDPVELQKECLLQ